jgi:hypothetical protein
MPIHSAVGTSIRKTSLLRTVPTACGQAADKLTPLATCVVSDFSHARSSELAHERDFHHVRCSERSYLFTMSDILEDTDPTGSISRVCPRPGGLEGRARNRHFADEKSSDHKQTLMTSRPDEQNPSWWSQTGSNRRPPACKAGALPTELWPLRLLARD